MKKALIVANLAGFASFLYADIQMLQEAGCEIVFAANANKLRWDDTRERLLGMGVTFEQIDFDSQNPFSKSNLRAYRQIKSLLKAGQFDIIHCHTPIAGILTRLAARKYRKKGAKVLYTTHGFAFTDKSQGKKEKLFRAAETLCSRYADAIVTINQEDYRAAQKMHCKNVYYIHGVGFDYARFSQVDIDRDAYRESIGVAKEDRMVLSVGELSHRKNHQIIIRALATLPDKEKYVYVICGNGINGGTGVMLTRLAEELGVRLSLLGFRSDIPEITRCSDVGAIPSLREGLGLSGVQSLAAGVPVVGTDVQGIRDYILDGETGYLYDANNAEGFADGIQRLLHLNATQKEAFCTRCKEIAKRFSKEISDAEKKEIYKEICL